MVRIRKPLFLQSLRIWAAFVSLIAASQSVQAAQPKAKIDPRAKHIFAEMAAAYQSLHSYSGVMESVDQEAGKNARLFSRSEITFQRPAQAMVVTSVGARLTVEAGADGNRAFVLRTNYGRKSYCEQPASRGIDVDNSLIYGAGSYAPFAMAFMSGENLFYYLGLDKLALLALLPQSKIDGVPVEVIEASYRNQKDAPDSTMFYVGKEDHLLRRVVDGFRADGKVGERTTTFSRIMVNATMQPGRFAFVPPADAVRVENPRALFAGGQINVKVNVEAPEFKARTVNGESLAIQDYRGKVVLVDFWAPWCVQCRDAVSSKVTLYRTFHSRGLEIVSVAEEGQQGARYVREFSRKSRMVWPQINEGGDGLGAIAESYDVTAVPQTVLIGRDGRVAGINLHDDELKKAVIQSLSTGN